MTQVPVPTAMLSLRLCGSQQYVNKEDMGAGKKVQAGVFKDSIRHDFRSPCYTTRWSDIPEAE